MIRINQSFILILIISFMLVKSAYCQTNDVINLLNHPCSIAVGKSKIDAQTTKDCLKLVEEFELKKIFNDDYLNALFYLETSALVTADYGIADKAFEKSMAYIETNKVEDPTLEMLIIESYVHYLILHKDVNLAKNLILKYLPKFKNIEVDKNKKNQKAISIIRMENNLAKVYIGQVNTTEQELQDAKIILENHLNVAISFVEEMWRNYGVEDKVIYSLRYRTLLDYGDLLKRLGKKKEGLKYKLKALNFALEKTPLKQHGWAYQDIGQYYHITLNDYGKAIEYYKKAIEIFEKDPLLVKELIYIVTLDGIASAYWSLEKEELGYTYSKKAADISLTRLFGQLNSDQLFSSEIELKKSKMRIDTHINNIYHLIFSEKISQKKRSALIEESIYYGQLLPQLKTAESLSYLQSRDGANNDDIKKILQEKFLLESKLEKLILRRDEERVKNVSNNEKLRDINKTIGETSIKIDKVIKSIQKLNPFYSSFSLQQASLNEILLMLDDDEALFFFHESFKPKEYQKWQNEEKNILLQGWIISREFTNMMAFVSFQKEERELYLFNYADNSKLLNHLNFTNTNYLQSSYPTDLSYDIYKSIFGDYLELPFKNKIKKLIIVNDGILYKVPYWALTTEPSSPNLSFRDQPWLSKKYALTISPSIRSFVDLRKKEKRVLGVKFNKNEIGLWTIIDIHSNSFASKNNLKIGDVILKVNGMNFIDSIQISNSPKNEPVELLISREDKHHTVIMPPLISANIDNKIKGYFDFIGIGNPDGLKKKGNVVAKIQPISFNELFSNSNDTTRGVNKRAIQEMPALPETEKELRTIAKNFDSKKVKLLLKEDATEKIIKKTNLKNVKYISFASHAVVAGEVGKFDEPGIILTPPTTSSTIDDGLLSASEIAKLDINADLVILSACNTGAGINTSTEGLTGLARSFFIAGSNEILVSNWRVTDKYAARLTTGMFDYLAKEENATKAEALQYSINELIHENLHPIFWAPFMLVGDGL